MLEFQRSLSMTMKEECIFNPSNIYKVFDILGEIPIVSYKGIEYYNVSCAFDIETSSFYYNDSKMSIMYEWTFGINGLIIIGRTWKEFLLMIRYISNRLCLTKKRKLLCYVHNLSFEYQYLRKLMQWENVFALKERKVISALSSWGIEFRCSYLLSAYRLEKVGEELQKYKIKKLVGDLDYTKIRHSKTKLTNKELWYCINDVLVVMAYIQEKIDKVHNIGYIPKTNTGYVRNYIRNFCYYEYKCKDKKKSFKALNYKSLMKRLTLDVDEYKDLKDAYTGGFTHASCFHSGKVMENVTSMDFTSSYPAVLVTEPSFPMGKGERYEITSRDDFLDNIKHYCCLFVAHFENVESNFIYEHFLSASHCRNLKNAKLDNGRIVSADSFDVTITEIDYQIMKRCYKWKKFGVSNFRRYYKGYLPKDFILAVLKLYKDKTELKGNKEKIEEYMHSKGMLNACYGCCVTDPARDIISYEDDKWDSKEPNLESVIDEYNNSSSRFLFYPWGVWCSKLAMRNLWTAILHLKEDYIYSDTDSVKFRNYEKHKEYFDKYNTMIQEQAKLAMNYLGIDESKTHPKTLKGEEKPIGVWDFDGFYSRFKCLRAKAYLVEYGNDERNKDSDIGKIVLTVSGLNKKIATPYLLFKYGKSGTFKKFDDDLYVPKNFTGTNTHTYIDSDMDGWIKDYQGRTEKFHESSGVHIESSDYSLSLLSEYVDYIKGVQHEIL